MPALRDLLQRFRPAGAPGAPAAVGVPVDRRARAELELEPVFVALASAMRTSGEIRRVAAALAEAQIVAASTRAAAIIETADRDAPAEWAAAAAASRRRAAGDREEIRAVAARDAARVRQRCDGALPALVDRALARLLSDVAALGGRDLGGHGTAGQ